LNRLTWYPAWKEIIDRCSIPEDLDWAGDQLGDQIADEVVYTGNGDGGLQAKVIREIGDPPSCGIPKMSVPRSM